MSQPLVSIIIPSYNRARIIPQAIQSVLNQTYENWELLIVDDGSSIPFELESTLKDPRIQILRNATNQGAAAARNKGIHHAKGVYIAFLDTDDQWLPHKLEKQVAFLQNSPPTVGGCVTACHLIYPHKKKIRYIPIIDFYQQSIRGEHMSAGSTLLFKRECLAKVGLQSTDLKRLEDWEWQINFSKYYTWHALPEALASIYVNTPPDFHNVKESIRTLQKRMSFKSPTDTKIFKNRCLYELALASYLDKKYIFFLYYISLIGIKAPLYWKIITKKFASHYDKKL